jgi:hypothetical protein
MQNYDERFQERIDEIAFLEQSIEKLAREWQNDSRDYQVTNRKAIQEMLSHINTVNDSLKKINTASSTIETYMTQCEHHANRTRNVFMGMVAACVLVIAGTLWWANDIRTNLAEDRKELVYLDELFKKSPDFQQIDHENYVRIVAGTETNELRNDDGHRLGGHYAKVWNP